MGWNHWNAYGCNITEDLVVGAAQSFVSLGLKDLGYHYVNSKKSFYGSRIRS